MTARGRLRQPWDWPFVLPAPVLKYLSPQFVKGAEYSEIKAMGRFSDLIALKKYGRGRFIHQAPCEEDKRMAFSGLEEVEELMLSGNYQVIILDEVNIATHFFPATGGKATGDDKKKTGRRGIGYDR